MVFDSMSYLVCVLLLTSLNSHILTSLVCAIVQFSVLDSVVWTILKLIFLAVVSKITFLMNEVCAHIHKIIDIAVLLFEECV